MKQLLELIPVVLFFIVYQMDGEVITVAGFTHTVDGIYSATKVLMASTLLVLPVAWLLEGALEKRLLWTSAAVLVFGGATLAFHNELFIQWKPTVFNWGMAIVFAGSQFIGDRNLLERLMGSQLALPSRIWTRVCWVWVAHFSVVGVLNLIVAYNFSEAAWVSYKLYSGIGFTVFIMIITAAMIGPALKHMEVKAEATDSELRP